MVRTRSQLSNEQSTALTSGYTLSSTREPSLNNRHATSASTSSPTPKDVQPLSKTAEQNVKGPSRLVEIGTEINVEEGEEVQDEDDGAEMIKWGCILLIGSAISFLVGIWSIAIGPLVETEGLGVSFVFSPLFRSSQS